MNEETKRAIADAMEELLEDFYEYDIEAELSYKSACKLVEDLLTRYGYNKD